MLYICATPIGNMEDITLRVLRTLKEVDMIACEDTRHSLSLLRHYDISKPLISFHEHNEKKRTEEIISLLKEGKEIALISDAGMPGIQDPGFLLIQRMVEEDLPYTVLPGASAVITAVVASNLAQKEFFFAGFLPRKKKEQRILLDKWKELESPIVVYEAPHRLEDTLETMFEVLGDRRVCILREVSKVYEEYIHTTLEQYLKDANKKLKGEFVIVVEGQAEMEREYSEEEVLDLLKARIEEGSSRKDAVYEVVKKTGLSKKQVYSLSLDLP